MLLRTFDRFFRHDASGGVLLMLSAVAAMIAANGPVAGQVNDVLGAKFSILINDQGLSKPLILWINDGLMAVFFLLIGLELKREMLEGKLRNPRDIILPGMAAVGGMAVPAVIYAAINWSNPETLSGWAIPAATDIAFALGILALIGTRAPVALKVFLLTLAILDDLGAIIVIALFYTAELKVEYLLYALVPLVAMWWLNMRQVHRIAPILMLGAVLWVLVLKSGVHATLAGVATAFFIPMKDKWGKSPLHSLEHALAPYVFFMIVPIFAFANAGVALEGMSADALMAPVPLGIIAGLVLGKQLGVFGLTFLTVKAGFAQLPHGVGWAHVYGVSALAGIGFTMSLFIGSLSFADPVLMNDVRLGVLVASGLSAVIGATVLVMAGNPTREAEKTAAEPA
ncbi:Na(+)/H(+) antiporter NhaA [Aliiroseovarius zhejiangensis]|uniref:Na(+)/H(+) antiporter NhaA n=1 Tax=Aliiroseovarius zhejiangensis TaxID=1632025 RepID=A0ABQ3IR44_9RHOB|nr:Na+/H+ antiporter NhaA [Aliiroseovarius zhejiangensis]GHE90152.1 Na(+)/H(+) antiporter NhaA [Aliiroseovarius zhejiangensis]